MRLVLVRHGRTASNVARQLDTQAPGADLDDLGREQARRLADTFGSEPLGAVYASTLVRTQQTAAPLARALGLEVEVREGLREIRAGALEMRSDDESVHTYLDTFVRWSSGDLDRVLPGGEDGRAVLARFDAVVDEIAASRHEQVIVFSHGAVIRYWTSMRASNVDTELVAARRLSNAGAVLLEGSPGDGWRVVVWEEEPLGGPDVAVDVTASGPAGEPTTPLGQDEATTRGH